MISNKLIAIDFGSMGISAMAAEVLDNGAVKIWSDESKLSDDVKCGIIEKPTGASFKVSEILKLIKNSSRISDISHVSVAVGAKSMKQITGSLKKFIPKSVPISENLLAELLEECKKKYENVETVVYEITPTSYMVDGTEMDDPVGQTAISIIGNYNIVIGNSIIKSELERCFDRTGFLIEYSPLAAEALATVVLEEQERKDGCALINFGATTTTLAIYRDDILQNHVVVPLGAKNITKDIQELGINEANAERLKCLKGYALESLVTEPMFIQIVSAEEGNPPVKISTQFLATIIEARLDEILEPIFEAISELSYSLDGGIVITGGGSKLNNIVDFIAEKTGYNVRFGNHNEWLSNDTNEKYHDPKYAQMVGTIILTHEYRKTHPLVEEVSVDPKKRPKLPTGKALGRIADMFSGYFADENENKF